MHKCLRFLVTLWIMVMCAAAGTFAGEPEAGGASASDSFYENQELKEELAAEIVIHNETVPAMSYPTEEREFYTLTHNGQSMKFFMDVIGEPGENGKYPLYLTLHGGGGAPEEENNDEWITMSEYYKESVENGIYIACRGITDTWDLHFQEASYPLYDRLIEAMIVNYQADPNRVYLLGFSAGGDGVYQIAPRLADRLAAVNMSSGHPNGVSLKNLANCPICLQAGIRDYYSEDAKRSIEAAAFDQKLADLRAQYGFGYEHQVWIHVPEGHNYTDSRDGSFPVLADPTRFAEGDADAMLETFLDVMEANGFAADVSSLSYFPNGMMAEFDDGITEAVTEVLHLELTEANTNAVRYVSQFVRDPAPERLVWDLSTRAAQREKDSFYWLEAAPETNQGVITASVDPDTNTVTVEPDETVNGDFTILFHPALIDASRPVTICTPKGTFTVELADTQKYLEASMLKNGDPELGCIGEVAYSALH